MVRSDMLLAPQKNQTPLLHFFLVITYELYLLNTELHSTKCSIFALAIRGTSLIQEHMHSRLSLIDN